MNIPKLSVARKGVSYLYDYLLANEEEDNCFHDAPQNASLLYEQYFSLGNMVYSK